jgi:hypothetical protein
MKYFQSWQDFMRQPEMMQLKEEKGIHACKQRYIQEQNKMQWYDPMILNETNSPGTAVTNAINADGSSTQYLTGNTAQICTVAFGAGTTGTMTSSADRTAVLAGGSAGGWEASNWFDIQGFYLGGDGSTADYTAGHTNSRYTFRCFMTTGSFSQKAVPVGYHGIITGSPSVSPGSVTGNVTGSILCGLKDSINTTAASALVGTTANGTIAPSTLFTATLNAGSSSLTVTNNNVGSATGIGGYFRSAIASGSPAVDISVSGSMTVSTTTNGLDTYEYDQGTQTFDATLGPWSNMPRK